MNTLSAICNTVIILTFGNLYKAIASALNDWENHRTQIQYEDAHITKTLFDRRGPCGHFPHPTLVHMENPYRDRM
jgi:hypothetical protein